ncbi:MAG: hypothetical protein ACI93L_003167, partial [Cyclobacteriaceae bacterium]
TFLVVTVPERCYYIWHNENSQPDSKSNSKVKKISANIFCHKNSHSINRRVEPNIQTIPVNH